MITRKLDELLLTEGLVDEQSLSLARTEALARQRKLAEIVIDLGLIDQRSLAALLAQASGAELISPIDIPSATLLAPVLPELVARRHQVVPVRAEPDSLVVAMIDPFEPAIVELLEAAAGTPVKRAVGVRSEIELAILDIYGSDDAADRTIQLAPNLFSLELDSATSQPAGDYSGVPDEWGTPSDETAQTQESERRVQKEGSREADSTAPSTARHLTEGERLAHVERQLLSVSRALAIIQSRLDTIDARLANLGSHPRVVK